MLTMIAAINEFERTNLLERQREGILIAKELGKYKGRKPIPFPENWKEIYNSWKTREITDTRVVEILNLKKTTFYKLIKEWKIFENKYSKNLSKKDKILLSIEKYLKKGQKILIIFCPSKKSNILTLKE